VIWANHIAPSRRTSGGKMFQEDRRQQRKDPNIVPTRACTETVPPVCHDWTPSVGTEGKKGSTRGDRKTKTTRRKREGKNKKKITSERTIMAKNGKGEAFPIVNGGDGGGGWRKDRPENPRSKKACGRLQAIRGFSKNS